MSAWKEAWNRLWYLGRRSKFESQLDDEIAFHIECRTEELQRSGIAPGAALAQARREFGSPARAREETRGAWQIRWLEELFADLHYACRAMRRTPTLAATAIACLALGIGANTTVFSIATEVLFSEPSVRDASSLLHVEIGGNSHAPLREYRFVRDAGIFTGLAGEHEEDEVNWKHGENSDRLFVIRVTENFFDVTGMPFALGRGIQPGEPDAAVVTHAFWQRRLGGDPEVLGRKLILDGHPFTVVGVLPRDHRTLIGFGFSPDLYLPVLDNKDTIVAFYGRMPQGMTRAVAFARVKAACQQLDRVYPDGSHKWADGLQVSAIAGMAAVESQLVTVAAFFAMLMLVAGMVLAIACANVASLLLARASSRSHELAVRFSLGAGRSRIVRQLLAESLLLAFGGTVTGLALNVWLTSSLSRLPLQLPIPIQFHIRPDWRLASYAALLSVGVAVAAGLLPALKATRGGLSAVLKQDEHVAGQGPWTMRSALVVAQLAVSIVLLCASLIFLRNLVQSAGMNPGFDTAHTVWAYMRLVPEKYQDTKKMQAMAAEGLFRLRAISGADAAGSARVVPFNGHQVIGTEIRTDAGTAVHATFHNNFVSADYFRAMGIPMLQGREFTETEARSGERVAIVNQNLARRLFGDEAAPGHTIRFREGLEMRVVGVAANSKYFTLGEEQALAFYRPSGQQMGANPELNFLVRAKGGPESLIPAIRRTLDELDGTAALEVRPLRNALALAMLPSRAGAAMLGATGLVGLTLAAIGLYGTLLYAVSRRTREIGLRMALGASPGGILRMVMRQSLMLAGAGIAIGTAIAIVAVRPLARFLTPEVHPADPANFLAVAAVLLMVALLATVPPAARALRVDPTVALRYE